MSFGTVTIVGVDGTVSKLTIEKATFTIGRAQGCDIVLNDPLAADQHAQIISTAQLSQFVALVDSANTRVDGKPAPRNQPIQLKRTSRIFVGGSSLVYQGPEASSPSGNNLLEEMLRTVKGNVTPPLGTRVQPAAPTPAPAATDDLVQRAAVGLSSAAASAAAAPTQALQTNRLSRDAGTLLVMTIKERPKNERVKTGQSITYVVEVTNRSEQIDSVYLTVEGIPTGNDSPGGPWVTILPERRALHPPQQGEVAVSGEFAIQIHPPRNSQSLAGLHRAAIVARFQTQQSVSVSEEIAFTVERFDDFKLEPLEPESQSAWRQANYVFTIKNDSNHVQEFSIKGRERERAIEFRCRPAPAVVDPGESQEIQVQALVTRGQQRFFGDRKDFNFTISVTPERSAALDGAGVPEASANNVQQLTGTLVQQPPLSQWVSLAALLITVFLCLCIGLTAALARFAPNFYRSSIAPAVGIVVPPLAPPTSLATAVLPTSALPPTLMPPPTFAPLDTLPPLDTPAPLPTPVPPDIDATFAPLKTQAAQELIAKKTEIAGQSDEQKTALAQQYVITATLIAISQAQTGTAIADSYAQTSAAIALANAQTGTAVAQANATQIALQQTQFSGTQTQQSLYATQTEAARPTNTSTPTPSNTPTPTLTPIADVVVNFATTASGEPVLDRTQIEDKEFFQQNVSICFFGPQPTQEPTVAPDEPTVEDIDTPDLGTPGGGEINAIGPAASAPVVRCQPPAILRYSGPVMVLAPVIYPPFKYVNSEVAYLTTDEGDGALRADVFAVITFQTDMTDMRIRIFHPNSQRVTYYTVALDERGEVVGVTPYQLGVLGPYALNVTASRPIRQVLLLGIENATEREELLLRSSQIPHINSPLLITQVEVNTRRR